MRHRIALVITELEPGGAERQMVELAVRLPRDEFEPQVLVLAPPPERKELTQRLAREEVRVDFLGFRRKWEIVAAVDTLARRFLNNRPQLVQCFLHHANTIGALAADRAGIPRLATGIRVAERRWNLHCFVARLTDRYVARHVCVSEAVADYAKNYMRLPESKLVVIPNGVDVARFANATPLAVSDLGLPTHSRLLLYVGRFDVQKQVIWLLSQMENLARLLPRHHLVLVGSGPTERHLRRLAARRRLGGRVHFLGWRSDVPQLLRAADMLLLSSRWEGMPNVILEAMAAGKPVVAVDAEGVAEVLGPLASGDTIKNGPHSSVRQQVGRRDATSFVESVTRLATDPALAVRIGRANQVRVAEEFSLKRMVHGYCDLYRDLMSEI